MHYSSSHHWHFSQATGVNRPWGLLTPVKERGFTRGHHDAKGNVAMYLVSLIDLFGESALAVAGGFLIGALFGFFAQRSRFCLRSAVITFSRGKHDQTLAVWLFVFAMAVTGTQLLDVTGIIDVSQTKFLASAGSMSGAIIGGLLFGIGMILSRGCSSRLLVLSATGNLRALLSGLIFAVVAQASLHGALSPLRDWLAGLWVVPANDGANMLDAAGLPGWSGVAIGLLWLAAGVHFARRNTIGVKLAIQAALVGLAIVAGWLFTYSMSISSFSIIPVKSLTFTGPSADTLMLLLVRPARQPGFNIGLVPGVFAGSFLAAWLAGELKLQGWQGGHAMKRYILGAALMGFGGMLAGGCAVGAGVTGGSVFALVAWAALVSMWIGAMATDCIVDRNAICILPGRAQGAKKPS